MNSPDRRARYAAHLLIAVGTVALALGVLLFNAASATGAASDYNIHVSWLSALAGSVWPLTWRLVGLLSSVFLLAILTSLIFFRASRALGAALLFLLAVAAGLCGGVLGLFFIGRELKTYHFRIGAERLGEYWFTFEAIAVWMLAVGTLAVVRIFAPKRKI